MILFLTGAILGFLFWKKVAGKYPGDNIRHSLRIQTEKHWIHLHHWIICAFLIVIFAILDIEIDIVNGFLTGGIVQGLTYRDRFRVFYKQ